MVCRLPLSAWYSFGVCVLYGAASLTLAMVNKVLLTTYGFECYFILLFSQMVVSLLACVISRDFFGNPFRIPPIDGQLLKSGLWMGVAGVLNVGVGLVALQMVNVPMFFCLRKLVSPVVLTYEYLTMGKVADMEVRGAVSVIVSGAIIAGWDTLNSDYIGYSLTILNNFLTAATSVTQKQFSDKTRLQAMAIVYVNALVAAPMSLVLVFATGEIRTLTEFQHTRDPLFWSWLLVSVLMGLVLTYSSMLCTTYNSPLATTITGNCKSIATTIIGWLAFPGFVATIKSVGGILVSFFGAFLYSYVNLQKELAKQQQQKAAAAAAAAVHNADLAAKAAPADSDGNDAASAPLSAHTAVDVSAGSGNDSGSDGSEQPAEATSTGSKRPGRKSPGNPAAVTRH